jgi:hypothetical protein
MGGLVIYLILTLLAIGYLISSTIIEETDLGVFKSTLLGLTLCIPTILFGIKIILDTIVNKSFKLGLMLGGESLESITEAVFRNIAAKRGIKIKGDESEGNEN